MDAASILGSAATVAFAAPMRIALVTETYPPEVNGVSMTVARLVEGLLARGHHLQLVRPRQHRNEIPRAESGFEEVLTLGLPIPVYEGLRFGFISERRLAQLWRTSTPDLVHVVTEGPLGWTAVRAARRLKLATSSGFHTNFHSYTRHYGISFLHRPVASYLRRLHESTQATLVPTRALAADLAASGYSNLVVVARGVDNMLFDPERRSAELRASWGLAEGDAAVLYVGRLAEEKNVHLVLRGFAAIASTVPRAKLIFVGDGPLRETLALSCPQALFAGTRCGIDLATHYASADLFLFPSLTETFGNVTTEAMASGLAVVAFDNAAAHELIQDGCNGRVVRPGDNTAFIRVAVELARDVLACRALGRSARASVMHLGWDRIHDWFSHTLGSIIQRHRQRLAAPVGAVSVRPPE